MFGQLAEVGHRSKNARGFRPLFVGQKVYRNSRIEDAAATAVALLIKLYFF